MRPLPARRRRRPTRSYRSEPSRHRRPGESVRSERAADGRQARRLRRASATSGGLPKQLRALRLLGWLLLQKHKPTHVQGGEPPTKGTKNDKENGLR